MTCADRLVAEHPRCWAQHQTLTDPTHAAAAAELRQRPHARRPAVDDVEQRSLADYDQALGLDVLNAAVAS